MLPSVSVRSVLPEMVDFDRLAYPLPYTHAQASSYDRRSNPGPHQDWFANGDYGQFVRTEPHADRTEYVMADLKGPGLVDRIWSANPAGIIRFYFNGEHAPRFQAEMKSLLTSGVKPLAAPFSYFASGGCNLYFPIPYAKSLKITVDDSLKNKPSGLYYHVGFRTYRAGTEVETFDPDKLSDVSSEMAEIAGRLTSEPNPPRDEMHWGRADILPGSTMHLMALKSRGVVRKFTVKIPFLPKAKQASLPWTDPRRDHNILRQLLLAIEVDGHLCVSTPLGDFFGSAPGINPYDTAAASMKPDGTMTFWLPMPYSQSFDVKIENIGPVMVPIRYEADVDSVPMENFPPYRLHAQWTVDRGHSRPFKDMNLLTVAGQGNWVGCNLAVANPSGAWWGEGDEKVYVDGESFPSTFGTGTEDFFGYAWSSPNLFQKPYHAQSRVDGPGVLGHTSVVRWQLFDPIPYTTSLKFDLERWHWVDVVATYGRTAYWYAPANSTPPAAIDRSLLLPEEIKPITVAGAIEGETLKILQRTGGTAEVQSGFAELSNGKQLWWRDAKIGDKLTLSVPVAKAGEYEVIAQTGHAQDYGIFQITLNGVDCGTHDFYIPGLEWKPVSLGKMSLPAGHVTLEILCTAHNPAAIPSNMFGLDYLLLKKLP
jgi:hypothetical protein